jgi:hypothetical protein
MDYLPDRPIEAEQEDKFNRLPFASRIANTIAHRTDSSSLVVGIFGKWGEGKTSVLNLMKSALKHHDDVEVVPFNPWHFTSQEQLLRGFFATLADALDERLKTAGESIGEILKKYGAALSVASVTFGGMVSVNPGAGASQLGANLSTVDLDKLRERVERILRESGKRVVVLIDDIDRLDRQEIQAIFKLVKLSASFSSTVYVLAFDDEMVADALGERYGKGGIEAGRQFLEKIIQVPLHLPPADRASLRTLAFQGAEDALKLAAVPIDEELRHTFPYRFTKGFEVRLTTPRQVVRYANALTFALPILQGEVNATDQLLIEGIRVFYPRLYSLLRETPGLFLLRSTERLQQAERQRIKDAIEGGFAELSPSEKDAVLELLQVLFPRLKGVFGNMDYGADSDREWSREKRVCSEYYFARYFTYAIPRTDVSDRAVDALIDLAEGSDEGAVATSLHRLITPTNVGRLIERLRLREDVIPPATAKRLTLAVAAGGESYPRGEDLFGIGSPQHEAAILVTRLLQRLPASEERQATALRVIQVAKPMLFAFECLKRLTRESLLSPDGKRSVAGVVVAQIRDAANVTPPYIEFPGEASSLLWVWSEYGPVGELGTYLGSRLAAAPEDAIRLVTSFAPVSLSVLGPKPTDLRREGYATLSQIVSPEVVLQALRAVHGDALDTDVLTPPRGEAGRSMASSTSPPSVESCSGCR